jgi:hypothetical protein
MSTTITLYEIQQAGHALAVLKKMFDETHHSRFEQGDKLIEGSGCTGFVLHGELIKSIQSRTNPACAYRYFEQGQAVLDNPHSTIEVERFDQSNRPVIISNQLALQIVDIAAQVAMQNGALISQLRHEARQTEHWRATANQFAYRIACLLAIKGVKKLAGRHGLLARWFKADAGQPA